MLEKIPEIPDSRGCHKAKHANFILVGIYNN